MTASFSTISVVLQKNSARITLNNPPLNVITPVMMEELIQSLAEIESNPDISIIVIDGKGSSFSAGVAVAAHTPDNLEAMLTKFHAVVRGLISSKKITVSKVRGNCLGGGAELAMVCDLSYTGKRARWAFPEMSLGSELLLIRALTFQRIRFILGTAVLSRGGTRLNLWIIRLLRVGSEGGK